MANSGGRPMFRTERQELSQVSHMATNVYVSSATDINGHYKLE